MKKLIPLKSIYAFVAVAETGSMTEAASVLNVSHSAISQAIKTLESQLDCTLFDRVGRQVRLNGIGKKYYKKVAPALEEIVAASEEISAPSYDHRLTLNMVNSLALHWWIPQVDQFQQYYPHIDIRISNIPFVFDLYKEGVDVALIHGKKEEWEQYHLEHLGDDNLVLVCSPKLLKTIKEKSDITAQLLATYPAIYVTNPRRKDDWSIWCDATGHSIPTHHNNLNFDATIQAMQAAITGLGVLVTHQQFIKTDLDAGMLTQIGAPILNPYKAFYFACPPEKLTLESVLSLRNWLRQAFSKENIVTNIT